MDVLGMLAIIVMLAALIEALVEAVLGEPLDHIPGGGNYKWLLKYAAYVVGVLGTVVVYRDFDLVYLMSQYVGIDTVSVTLYGEILTGLAIGRGAQWLHEFLSKYFKKPVQPMARG